MGTVLPCDSSVMKALKEGPRANGNWPGFNQVYLKISKACEKMAMSRNMHLSEVHIETMADLGSGHEERMKYRLHWLMTYKWI